MKASVAALEADLARTVEYFNNDKFAVQLPFMRSFPKNTCEVVSAFIASILAARYLDEDIARIWATTESGGEHHLWVEASNKVVDPTADQFDMSDDPFVCDAPSPLFTMFPHVERETPNAALHALTTLGNKADEKTRILLWVTAGLWPSPSFSRSR